MNKDNDRFERKICQLLDRSIDEMDGTAQARIARLKFRALEQKKREWRKLLLTAAAAVVVLVLFFSTSGPLKHSRIPKADNVTMELLLTEDDLDFYTEDLGFYEWLSEVLENEDEQLDRRGDVSSGSGVDLVDRSGNEEGRTPPPGSDRVPGSLRG